MLVHLYADFFHYIHTRLLYKPQWVESEDAKPQIRQSGPTIKLYLDFQLQGGSTTLAPRPPPDIQESTVVENQYQLEEIREGLGRCVIPMKVAPLLKLFRGFPGGAVVRNPPANAGDTGSSPAPEGSPMPWSS